MSTASIVLILALISAVAALSGLVLALVGVSRRRRVLLGVGLALAALGAFGFAGAGTLTLSTAVGQAGAAAIRPTPTTLEQRQWFRLATGITLPAGSDPIAGMQNLTAPLATYYLVIAPSPQLERMLDRDFTPTSWDVAQSALSAAPPDNLAAWRLVENPDVRYYTLTYELPSRAVFVSYVAVDPVTRAVYFVGMQVSD